jgi:hypothetical protein
MINRKLLTSTICLISVFVLMGTAQAFNWTGFSELCVDGTLKGPSGEVECTFTLEEVTVVTACYNEQSDPNAGQCKQGEAHTAGLMQTIYPYADGEKVKNLLNVDGCFDFNIYDHHNMIGHEPFHSCDPESEHMVELEGSAYVDSFVAVWECRSTKTGNVIETGRDTCTYDGTVDPDTCFPEHAVPFNCIEETFGKKYTFE